jgi:hypothetical protein
MKKLLLFSLTFLFSQTVSGQGLRIVFEDVFYGTASGALLSTSVMAHEGKTNWDHYRWGVGGGMLFGAGTGAYDVFQAGGESGYFVKGMLSQASSSAKIVFMDGGYGAGIGTLIGFGYALMASKHLGDASLTGFAYGTWAGLAFGVVDAFVLSRQSDFPFTEGKDSFYSGVSTTYAQKGIEIGLPRLELIPNAYSTGDFTSRSVRPGARIAAVNVRF